MSNKASIIPTKFESVRTGEISFGVRVCDDQAQAYTNIWDAIPDDDLEVLRLCLDEEDETIVAILDFVAEQAEGCYIGNEWYEWDEIKHLWG